MQVRDARALAARWVADHAAEVPGFAGALLGGSTAWLPDDAELPATSDVDVMVVTGDPAAPPDRRKRRYGGALLEVTVLPWTQLRSPEQVLASYHLAGLLRAGAVLADPTGRLAELQAATARDFAKRVWVRRRCRNAEQRILDGLGHLDPSAPLPAQVLTWVFPTGVTTHVLLTAGLRNPTVRLRYLAVRTLLGDYGRLAFHEELLALLGCAQLPRERVGQHLAAMTAAFDQGHHREAVFWIVVTYARCLAILTRDAPAARRYGCAAEVLGAFQVSDPVADEVVADLLGAAPGVGEDLVAGEAEDGVALGDQVAVAAALADDLVGAGPDRSLTVDLDHHPGQDQEVDPVGADLAVGLDPGALGSLGEPGGQPEAGQGALDPAEQAAGCRVGLRQQLDHGGTEGGAHRLRPSWSFVAASGDRSLHWHSPARPVRA
jgi:hypothetical protein